MNLDVDIQATAVMNETLVNQRPVPAWKRAVDILVIIASSFITVPVALAVTALIWVTSRGPIFFVQERVGLGGRRFRCYKFRTMHHGCQTTSHQQHLTQLLSDDKPMQKLDAEDPRLIPGARVIRAMGLDELAQLWNVLRGDMSIVGPRPCIPYELEQYQPWQMERFATLPGLTGWWQVRGKNRTTFTQMTQLDIEYVRNQSIWMDLHILLLTPKTLINQLLHSRRARRAAQTKVAAEAAAEATVTTAGALPTGEQMW